ncbi:hypothetical protein KFV02_03990 [Desulfohalobiaceae bacterium Ax17]|uniref:hypothetical protein n=1 Tax=Desulfovulcanus ferrireducens TaxID=2831190 RepID=UPI00207B99CF|nr:hypothetical protein [Desulfovulcanus ferrireducens]MBT8763087.1 hypothetical protein [Desulfovulcanus ferrireducens]
MIVDRDAFRLDVPHYTSKKKLTKKYCQTDGLFFRPMLKKGYGNRRGVTPTTLLALHSKIPHKRPGRGLTRPPVE